MTYKKGNYEYVCTISQKKPQNQTTLKYLEENFNSLIECFYGSSSRVLAQGKMTENSIKDEVQLTVGPLRFTVDFKDESANISLLR